MPDLSQQLSLMRSVETTLGGLAKHLYELSQTQEADTQRVFMEAMSHIDRAHAEVAQASEILTAMEAPAGHPASKGPAITQEQRSRVAAWLKAQPGGKERAAAIDRMASVTPAERQPTSRSGRVFHGHSWRRATLLGTEGRLYNVEFADTPGKRVTVDNFTPD